MAKTEHVEKYPHYYLAKLKMVLNDSELAVEYSNLLMKQKKKYKYEDIKPCFGTGSIGERGWSNVGWLVYGFGLVCFIISAVISSFLEVKAIKGAGFLIFLLCILVGLVFFLLRFIKHECVYIYHKNDDTIVNIRVTETSKDFIEEFQKRVELANKPRIVQSQH